MKRHYYFIVFSLSLILPVFSLTFLISTTSNIEDKLIIKNSGISKYDINQNVTYELEINFTLTHNDALDDQTYHLDIARFSSRNTNYSRTPPYQVGSILYNNSSGFDVSLWNYKDQYNNTYDRFNATLDGVTTTQIQYSIKYEITINEIYFEDIDDSDIGDYDTSEEIFNLYRNNTEEYYNISDPDLIYAALNEVGVTAGDNLVEKAEKIYNFVIDRLNYELPSDEMGASWAYDNSAGDCSEFSSLMITLLRLHGIPARKVTGLVISNDPTYRPSVGDVITFDSNYVGSTQTQSSTNPFLGHAWVEYYVPQIGWIVSDPTWGQGGQFDYFNRLDYLHLTSNVGSWFSLLPPLNYTEYPYMPNPAISDITPNGSAYDYTLTAVFTVTDVDLIPLPEFDWLLLFIVLGIIAIVITAVVIIVKRRNR